MANSGKGSAEGKDYAEKLDRLLQFLYDTEESDVEEVKEALASYGIDPDELVKEGLSFIKSLEKQERAKAVLAKRTKLAEVFQKLRSIDKEQPIDLVRRRFNEILKSESDSQFALAFAHKHKDLNDGDLRNLLSDAELLKHLEEALNKLEHSEDE